MVAESLGGYLESYGKLLVKRLDQISHPLVESGYRSTELDFLREPYPAQRDRAEAASAAWSAGQSVLLSGRTGTGKTIVAMASIHLHAGGKPYRALICCPSHLVRKWGRELRLTIPGVKVRVISKYSDIVKMQGQRPAQGPEYYLLSDSKAKLGTAWQPAYVTSYYVERVGPQGKKWPEYLFLDSEKSVRKLKSMLKGDETIYKEIACPVCRTPIEKKLTNDGESVTVPASPEDISKRQCKCENCGEPLFQWTRRFDRWPCADMINRRLPHWFQYYVHDESHEASSASSASGHSCAQLASVIKHKMAMTGTIMNGYAHSLFPTLYRFNSSRMQELGFEWSDTTAFTQAYGRIETITTHEVGAVDYRTNKVSKGRQLRKNVRVKPGIVPSLYGDCMIGNTLFLQLGDMGFALPPQHTFLHGVDMDPEQFTAYKDMESELRDGLAGMLRSGNKSAMSVLLNTLIGWPDYPREFGEVGYWDNGEEQWVKVCDPPEMSLEVTREKERRLVAEVVNTVNRGNQAWIYTVMTGKRDVQVRLESLLLDAGIDVRILRSHKVPTDKREEWIEKNGDAQCMIMHPRLVATGLDAFDSVNHRYNFNALFFYSTGFVLDLVRQAAGRALRIGQTKDCELHYFYYKQTMQEQAAKLMADKTRAAESIDGNLIEEGLAALAGSDENVAMTLVRTLMKRF